MDPKGKNNLGLARSLFYSQRLNECYSILRRYFDRLPFSPEQEHAEYIGIFARTLAELGKVFELKFYMVELERLHEKSKRPDIAYQLAVIYSYLPEPRRETTRAILEELIHNNEAKDYQVRAKMLLADYYDTVHNDVGTCRRLIDSIDRVDDPNLALLVEIWKAKVLRDERRFEEAENLLVCLLGTLTPQKNWYAYFSAKIIFGGLLILTDRVEGAHEVITEIRTLFDGRHFKSAQIQVQGLERQLVGRHALSVLSVTRGLKSSKLVYEDKSLFLCGKSPSEKLLLLFTKRRFLDKEAIVKKLYARKYNARRDDKLIYYHIHSVRKRLATIGLPPRAVASDGKGYRLVPEVKTLGEEL